MGLKNKVIIITGASSGIGMETARLLAKKGAKLALLNRTMDDKIPLNGFELY